MSLAKVFAPEQVEANRRALTIGRRRVSASAVNFCSYMIQATFSPSLVPEGYRPAITGSTTELGGWDETKAMALTPWKMNPLVYNSGLLPAPQSATLVEIRWILTKDLAKSITEVGQGFDPQRVNKYLDLEPDFERRAKASPVRASKHTRQTIDFPPKLSLAPPHPCQRCRLGFPINALSCSKLVIFKQW